MSSRPHRQLPKLVVNVLAAFMALLAMSQPMANTLHHVFVRHVVCAIHGDLIHAGEEHAFVPQTAEDDGRPAARSNARAASHDHDDCTVPVISGDRALEASRTDALRVLAMSFSRSSEPVLTATPSLAIRLYLIAPKNSPPVARA